MSAYKDLGVSALGGTVLPRRSEDPPGRCAVAAFRGRLVLGTAHTSICGVNREHLAITAALTCQAGRAR